MNEGLVRGKTKRPIIVPESRNVNENVNDPTQKPSKKCHQESTPQPSPPSLVGQLCHLTDATIPTHTQEQKRLQTDDKDLLVPAGYTQIKALHVRLG